MRPFFIIIPFSLMMAMIDASTKADDVVALFKFLPSTQFNQLKPKIFGILDNSDLSKKPISKQAISITSDILNAFLNVVGVHPKGRLRKRSAMQPFVKPKEPKQGSILEWYVNLPKDASHMGLFDAFALEAGNLKHYIELTTKKIDDDFDVYQAKSVINGFLETSKGHIDEKLSEKILRDLEALESKSMEEQRSELRKLLLRKIPRLMHPDKNRDSPHITELFQHFYPSFTKAEEELTGDQMKKLAPLYSEERLQAVIEHIKAYEKGKKWWFMRSQAKEWEKLLVKIKEFEKKFSKQDLADLKKALEYKEKGLEVPHDLQMKYWYRSFQKYTEIIQSENEILEKYLYETVEKNGPKLYADKSWTKLQYLLEERQEGISVLNDFIKEPFRTKIKGNLDTQVETLGAAVLERLQQSQLHHMQKWAIPTVIGGLVLLTVLAFLKEKFQHPSKANAPKKTNTNMYDGKDYESIGLDNVYKNRNTKGDLFYDQDADFDAIKGDYHHHRKKHQ